MTASLLLGTLLFGDWWTRSANGSNTEGDRCERSQRVVHAASPTGLKNLPFADPNKSRVDDGGCLFSQVCRSVQCSDNPSSIWHGSTESNQRPHVCK